jgi:hypothetical protein
MNRVIKGHEQESAPDGHPKDMLGKNDGDLMDHQILGIDSGTGG